MQDLVEAVRHRKAEEIKRGLQAAIRRAQVFGGGVRAETCGTIVVFLTKVESSSQRASPPSHSEGCHE